MSNVIVAQGLTKCYGGRAALDQLDLAVPGGAIFALLGDNGAGKTTALRLLTGQMPADAGRAEVLGEDCYARAVELRHRVGYVPERPRFYDWMSVDEIGRFVAGFHKQSFLGRYRELTGRFALEPGKKLKHLSKGGYAKVALALALAPDPEVLILDEPTSGLDLLTRREFLTGMVDLAGDGRTVLISSHQIAEVERVASHVAFLSEGKLLLSGPVEDLRSRVVRLRLRYEGAPPDAASLGTVLERNGSGRLWQALVRDPDRTAVEALRHSPNVAEFEEVPVGLEEMYCGLMALPVAEREGRS